MIAGQALLSGERRSRLCCPSPEGSPYDKARRTKVKRSHEIIALVVAVMVGILVLAVGYYQQSSNLN
jgi:hypothetical protein